jgi:gamma-aminobutyric acid type B receptor
LEAIIETNLCFVNPNSSDFQVTQTSKKVFTAGIMIFSSDTTYMYIKETLPLSTHAVTHSTPSLEVTPPYIVLGPACNQPTYFTASLTSRYLKNIHIAYSASTPLLSDVDVFPLFYRTVPSYTEYSSTIYALMLNFDWLSVGVVHQEISHYTRALEDLNTFLSENSKGTASVIASLGMNSFLTRNLDTSLTARIFIAMVPENMVAETICTAHKLGMTGETFQWILLGDYKENWWVPGKSPLKEVRCTRQEMLEGVESALILSHHQLMLDEKLMLLSTEERDFWREYAELVNTTTGTPFQEELAIRVKPTYDAVWAAAHALQSTLSQATSPVLNPGQATPMRFDGRNAGSFFSQGLPVTDFTSLLNKAMERTDFEGLSGRVQFDSSTHTRGQPLTYISQMQEGRIVPIGVHSPALSGAGSLNLTFFGNNFSFQGPAPPRDRPLEELQSVQLWMVFIMISIAMFGIIVAISFLVVNCIYRKHKVIKASSPYLNFVIGLGCIMGFLSIIFMSTEGIKVNFAVKFSFPPFFCNVRLWLLAIGFTLAFGALFAKTWRIYAIFRNPWKRKRPYKDYVLFCMVAILLLFDLIILILWAIVDPLKLDTALNMELAAFRIEKYAYCINKRLFPESNASFIIWTSVVVIPKSLLLLFGVFLVVQTSRIKARFFQDAKFTGIAIFGCVMVCGVGVPVSFFMMFFFHEDIGYVVATSTILICCYLVLCMVFIPKFILLRRYKNQVPSAVLIGLNPSFRIRRMRKLEASCKHYSRGGGGRPPMSYYAQMIRGTTGSVYSRTSQSSSSSDDTSCAELQERLGRRETVELEKEIGWEPAFDDDNDGEVEVRETKVGIGGYQYIATVHINMVCRPNRVSTDTRMTVIPETDMEDHRYDLDDVRSKELSAPLETAVLRDELSNDHTELPGVTGANGTDLGSTRWHYSRSFSINDRNELTRSGELDTELGSSGTNRYCSKTFTIVEREEHETIPTPPDPTHGSHVHQSSLYSSCDNVPDVHRRTCSRVTPSPTPSSNQQSDVQDDDISTVPPAPHGPPAPEPTSTARSRTTPILMQQFTCTGTCSRNLRITPSSPN